MKGDVIMQKNRYKVYQVDHMDYGDGHVDTRKTLLRYTYAVSEKQAINNVRHSMNIKPADLFCAYRGDGCRRSTLVAELTHTSRTWGNYWRFASDNKPDQNKVNNPSQKHTKILLY